MLKIYFIDEQKYLSKKPPFREVWRVYYVV